MSSIRRAAAGERCTLRIANVCNGDWRTTVLCHFRVCAVAGMGQKPPDLFGAFGCSACHSCIDRRVRLDPPLSEANRYWYLLRGLNETHQRLLELGVIKIQ